MEEKFNHKINGKDFDFFLFLLVYLALFFLIIGIIQQLHEINEPFLTFFVFADIFLYFMILYLRYKQKRR